MSLEKTAHVDNVSLLREQLQSLQTRLSTLQGWRMKELTDEQVESVSEEVRDAMRACCPYPKPLLKTPTQPPTQPERAHRSLTLALRRHFSRRVASQKVGRGFAG